MVDPGEEPATDSSHILGGGGSKRHLRVVAGRDEEAFRACPDRYGGWSWRRQRRRPRIKESETVSAPTSPLVDWTGEAEVLNAKVPNSFRKERREWLRDIVHDAREPLGVSDEHRLSDSEAVQE